MNELISIIIPLYNAENYIGNCLSSILNQTYENLEIIVVDDGSRDNSYNLCEQYARKDSRIKIIKKRNGGPSSARNKGLECAKGEYIAFIDADDVVEKNYIRVLYNLMINDSADISACGYDTTLANGKVISQLGYAKESYTFKSQNITNIHYPYTVWSLMFKRDAIDKVRFDERIFFLEDLKFVDEVFMRCNRIVRVSEALYHRISHSDSLTEKRYDRDCFEKYFTLIQALEDICSITKPCDWLCRERKISLIKETAKIRALMRNIEIKDSEKKCKLKTCAQKMIREVKPRGMRENVILWTCVYMPQLYCKVKGIEFKGEKVSIA